MSAGERVGQASLVGACNDYATDGRVCNRGTKNCTMTHSEAPHGRLCIEVTGIDEDPFAREWSGRGTGKGCVPK